MKINQKQLENIVERATKHVFKKIVNEVTLPHKMIGDKGYQYIPLKTFEDAQKFGEMCPMTFCHSEKWFNWFDEHGCQLVCFLGKKTFFVCIKNGSIDEIRHINGEQCELEEFEEETGITPEDIRNISNGCLNESRYKRTLKKENMKMNQKQLENIVENATKVAFKRMIKENVIKLPVNKTKKH